jgi:hypothetical protein
MVKHNNKIINNFWIMTSCGSKINKLDTHISCGYNILRGLHVARWSFKARGLNTCEY